MSLYRIARKYIFRLAKLSSSCGKENIILCVCMCARLGLEAAVSYFCSFGLPLQICFMYQCSSTLITKIEYKILQSCLIILLTKFVVIVFFQMYPVITSLFF